MSKPNHHTRLGFRNPPGSPPFYRIDFDMAKEAIKFSIEMRRMARKKDKLEHHWVETPESALQQMQSVVGKENAVTWLGHASFIVHIEGLTILTDPFLTDYASPVALPQLKRLVPSAISIPKLPKLDMILLSHNHYDHMDAKALKALAKLQPDVLVVVPLRLRDYMIKYGFKKVVELDWYQDIEDNGATVSVVPAVHFSRRTAFDTNRTLWCGFVVRKNGKSFYFAGDTAYGEVFKEMGNQYGPIDVGLIPIGAYQPRKIMAPVHATPEEGIAIAEDMKVHHMVGMHWGTIRLTSEPMLEPAQRFMRADTSVERVLLKIGETRLFEELAIAPPDLHHRINS